MAAMDEDVVPPVEPATGPRPASTAHFDLESYISNYTGHTKVDRLIFIADRSGGKPLELEALKLAHDELVRSDNMVKYQEVAVKIDNRLGAAYKLDRNMMETSERRSAQRNERLESELHGFKTNLIKESIRMGQNDLGDHFYDRGDLQNAFRWYVRTRDYCTTSKHIVSMCLQVIKVSIENGNHMHAANHVAKAEQTPDVQSDPVVMGKLRAAAGLGHLYSKKYKLAARKFVEVSSEVGTSYQDVLAMQDVGTYGALCALATFDRSELQSKVLSNLGFKEFLELVPEVRELILDFYHSRYASMITRMAALQPSLLLDMHLHEHVHSLYTSIRRRALVQYTAPFTSVNLHTMAAAFNTTLPKLEQELSLAIMEGQIQARIDSHAKVLYARHADVRSATFTRVLQMGEDYMRETKALLLRASVLQHDLLHKAPRGEMMPGLGVPGMGPRGGGMGMGMGRHDRMRDRLYDRDDRGDRGDRGGASGSGGSMLMM